MSYRLYLCHRQDKPTFDEVCALRKVDERWGWNDRRFTFRHKETEVIVDLSYCEHDLEGFEGRVWAIVGLRLGMPRVYGRQAIEVLAALVERFPSEVVDPQQDSEIREFDLETLPRAWDKANEAFFAALAPDQAARYLPMASAQRELMWRWNSTRNQRQAALQLDVFVPMIAPWVRQGQLVTAVVWSDAIPILLPKVDLVVLYLDRIKPRTWKQLGTVRLFWPH